VEVAAPEKPADLTAATDHLANLCSAKKKGRGRRLSDERAFKVPQIHDWGANINKLNLLLLSQKSQVLSTQIFLTGAQELKSASGGLSALKSSFPFSDDSEARVVRRGVLSCPEFSKGCVFVFYPAAVAARPLLGIPLDQQ
jgi:hypothetical protein